MIVNSISYRQIKVKIKRKAPKKKSVIVQMLIKHTMIYFKNYKVGAISALCVVCFWITVQSYKFTLDKTVPSSAANSPTKTAINQVRNKDDYLEQMDILNKQKVDMDDPRLISLIRNYWIENPSDQPYNLNKPQVLDPSIGQAAFADNRLNFKTGGFFVECGALDGETRSNTLIFERLRSWNGLLIEADPSNYKLVKKKNRKAFTINACLSVYPYPVKMQFKKISVLERYYRTRIPRKRHCECPVLSFLFNIEGY
ncbi:unnamed protein product [Mytilus edulis]|uniref:Uncharacterized protein n=1 Tax=Mytilus edulis TaxID=6550 RepID=A0A8S3S647_MYTED|nr:unnamed protein product [Mytilus edulis]